MMPFLIRLVFAVGACALMAVAAALLIYAPWTVAKAGFAAEGLEDALLDAVGYVIVAIALFDVAKYFFEEEVPATREKRTAAETRRGLTKFVSTIIVAVFLEALVQIFKQSHERVEDLVYPALLICAACLTLLSLGLFQRLSASAEAQVGPSDRAAAAKDEAEAAGK